MKSCGIVGLPNVGKSTIFKVLSGKKDVLSENYPFCTIEPNVGVAIFKDKRLDDLEKLFESSKKIYQTVQFVDIAGLVEGASKGEGLGNMFLSAVRNVSAILHVVRCFDDKHIIHVCGNVDYIRDIKIIENELILADLQNIENILQNLQKGKNKTDDFCKVQVKILENLYKCLSEGIEFDIKSLEEQELKVLSLYQFLTLKPMVYLANISEDLLSDEEYKEDIADRIKKYKKGAIVVFASSKFELDLSEMIEEEKKELMEMSGLKESSLDVIIKNSMHAIGYQTFFTVGKKESRAWDVKKGGTPIDAASEIHTDLGKKFVRAEVIAYKDMVDYETRKNVMQKGLMQIRGASHILEDGDIVNILASS